MSSQRSESVSGGVRIGHHEAASIDWIIRAPARVRDPSCLRLARQVAQKCYLIVTEHDFAKASGMANVMVEGQFLRKKRLGY